MLNEKQYKLLKFIYDYWVTHEQSPTVQEIRRAVEFDPTWQLNILKNSRYIKKSIATHRGLTVTEAGEKALEYGPNPDVDTSVTPKRWDNIRRLPKGEKQ